MHIELLHWQPEHGWRSQSPALVGPPDLVLCFGDRRRLLADQAGQALRQRFAGAPVASCSTGTVVLADQVDDDAMVAVALQWAGAQVVARRARVATQADSQRVGAELGQALRQAAGPAGLGVVLVLSDGLKVNGNRLIEGLSATLGPRVPVVGGMAGDGAAFQTTVTGLNGPPEPDQVVVLGLAGPRLASASAAAGGWDPFGPSRQVSAAQGPVLLTLDDEPALDLYERYLGDEARDLPASALIYPLLVWPPGQPDKAVVRTVLAVDAAQRSLSFAADIPVGWQARLMRGQHERLVQGAVQAATRAALAMPPVGTQAGERLAWLVSCVGRRLLMGQRTGDEVEAVQRALGPGTRCIGFYSYGELAPPQPGQACELHNQTMTVTLLAETDAPEAPHHG